MLARQAINAVQAVFQLLLTLWVGVEVIDEAIEFADRVEGVGLVNARITLEEP